MAFSNRHALGVMVCALLLVGDGCGFHPSEKTRVEQAHRRFRKALQDESVVDLRACLSSESLQEMGGADPRERLRMLKAFVPKEVRITGATVEGDNATIELEASLDGRKAIGRVALLREGGLWKIDRESWRMSADNPPRVEQQALAPKPKVDAQPRPLPPVKETPPPLRPEPKSIASTNPVPRLASSPTNLPPSHPAVAVATNPVPRSAGGATNIPPSRAVATVAAAPKQPVSAVPPSAFRITGMVGAIGSKNVTLRLNDTFFAEMGTPVAITYKGKRYSLKLVSLTAREARFEIDDGTVTVPWSADKL
jgi:hypothetical protein